MKISTLLKTMGAICLVLSALIVTMIYQVEATYTQTKITVTNQMEFKQLGIDLANASDYLTNQARMYAVTGNKEYYDNYWKEVNQTKTRDSVVAKLKELNAPANELAYIEQAKINSDALVKTEDESMKAVQAGNMEKARQLMFDANYEKNKAIIMKPIADFQTTMNARAENGTNSNPSKADEFICNHRCYYWILGSGNFVHLWHPLFKNSIIDAGCTKVGWQRK